MVRTMLLRASVEDLAPVDDFDAWHTEIWPQIEAWLLDHASDRVATMPRIVDIGMGRDWPDHFNHPHYPDPRGRLAALTAHTWSTPASRPSIPDQHPGLRCPGRFHMP